MVVYAEQTRGWLPYAAKAKSLESLVDSYARLERHLNVYRAIPLLGFCAAAAVRFQDLKRSKIMVGTVDLRIAAVALAHDAVLVTRNRRDFQRVSGLRIEEWSVEADKNA